MSIAASFARGETGHLVSWDGETMILNASAAYAPGSPIEASLSLQDGPLRVEGRTKDSKRDAIGAFNVRVRIINLRREDKARLLAALASEAT